jgi:iron complex transport system substrate-binding protein
MKKILFRFGILFLISFFIPSAIAAPTPKRIVSLKPNITELLFAMGAGDKVVGVTTWCDRPDAAKKLPKVADYIKPNIEKILVLKPDLIIASQENSVKAPFEILENSGIEVLYLTFKNIDDLMLSINKLSRAVGHYEEGERLINEIKEIINSPAVIASVAKQSSKDAGLLRRIAPRNDVKPKALIIVGKRPLVAAGTKTFLGEIVKIAGGENIIKSKILYPHIDIETVIARDPDIIIDLSMGSEADSKEWQKYDIKAAKTGRIHNLNMSDFRLGARVAEQIEGMKKILEK